MAGHDDGEAISSQCSCHRPPGLRTPDSSRHPGIASGLPVGDGAGCIPDSPLKRGSATEVEPVGKGHLLSLEVAPESVGEVAESGRIFIPFPYPVSEQGKYRLGGWLGQGEKAQSRIRTTYPHPTKLSINDDISNRQIKPHRRNNGLTIIQLAEIYNLVIAIK